MDLVRRRCLMLSTVAAGALAASIRPVAAQAPGPALSPSDPQAAALGYTTDHTKVDAAKYPKKAPGDMCGNCNLYQGKAGAESGGCPIFAGRTVAANGWCSVWVKKG